MSTSTIGRIWRTFDLKPHRAGGFKLSNDPLFVEKVYDVIGLYIDPPEAAVVYCVDWGSLPPAGAKSQVQALARSQLALAMMLGMPEKRTHDYVRHGMTSLFAAFNTADGSVISSLHRRHQASEFKKFLTKIDIQVPADLDVHPLAGFLTSNPRAYARDAPAGRQAPHTARGSLLTVYVDVDCLVILVTWP